MVVTAELFFPKYPEILQDCQIKVGDGLQKLLGQIENASNNSLSRSNEKFFFDLEKSLVEAFSSIMKIENAHNNLSSSLLSDKKQIFQNIK